MLFWLFVILATIGIIMIVVGDKKIIIELEEGGFFVTVISGIVAVLMLTIIIVGQIGANEQVEGWREKYKAIMYKIESGACKDEFGLLNKEIIDEAQAWNESLAIKKHLQRNFWIGVFIPNVYDEFEMIDYEKIQRGGKP